MSATAPLADGTRTYSITSVDAAGNTRVQTGYPVTVDNVVPTALNLETANTAGGTQGRAEAGDPVTFTYSERIDPQSILTGWTGAPADVVVRLIDGGCVLVVLSTLCAADSLAVYDVTNSNALPLGTVDLGASDYHGTTLGILAPLTFGAIGTPSEMQQSGAAVVVTLGTASTAGGLAEAAGTTVWTPSATAYGAAGNNAATTAVTETGTADKEF